MKTLYIKKIIAIITFILVTIMVYSQPNNCNSIQEVNLYDNAIIQFDPNCSCGTGSNCKVVRINFHDSTGVLYECQAYLVQPYEWHPAIGDLIDLFDPVDCSIRQPDGVLYPSHYTHWISPFQVGGYMDVVICAVGTLPQNELEISFSGSDYCFPAQDTIPTSNVCPNGVVTFDKNSDQIVATSPLSGNPDFTVEFLTKLNPSTSGGTLIRKLFKWIAADNSEPFIISNVNNNFSMVDRYFDEGNNYIVPFNVNIRDGSWHHIAVSKQGNLMTVYLDNNVYSYTTNVTATFDLPNRIKLGRTSEFVSTSLDGQMDEFRIWDYARSASEVQNGMASALSGSEQGLLLYYNFDQGYPDGDNSCLKKALDKTGNGNHGTMISFAFNGTASNITTSDLDIKVLDDYCNEDPCPLDEICTDACSVDEVDLSTGVNFNDGSLLSIGEYEGGWQLISGPDMTLSYPRPGFVLQPNTSAWHLLPEAQYISPFPNANNNQSHAVPYLFERKFCVCVDKSDVTIDLTALVDNFIDIGLYDESGNLVQSLLNYSGPPDAMTFHLPGLKSITSITLGSGIYSLRAGLRNDASVTMGMAIKAIIRGAGLIESKCCSPFAIITGTSYIDGSCDGSQNQNDGGLGGAMIVACSKDGMPIDTVITDHLGYFTFNDLPIGDYLIKQLPHNGYDLSEGSDGILVSLGENEVEGDINFGNCLPEYCTDECAVDEVDLSTGVNFNDGSLLSIGEYEGGWQLISGPDMTLSYPRPGFVLQPNTPAWHLLPGAQYISPFPNANNNQSHAVPYLFERKFCVCVDKSDVTIDLTALVDNFIDIGLYDESGVLIQDVLSYSGPPIASTFHLPGLQSTTSICLPGGVYSLRAGLRNDASVTMGMAIKAIIRGAGLIESKCCSPFAIITGTSYIDGSCDGSQNENDGGLGGAMIVACSKDGMPIDTVITDHLGYFTFNDLPIGDYLIKQLPHNGFDLSEGSDGILVSLGENEVEGDINFGNCLPEYCTDECATDKVNISTGIDVNTDNIVPSGQYEGSWQLIDGPNDGLNYPRPSYVLTPHPAWASLNHTMYISPFPHAYNNEQYDEPYLFEKCFCVCNDGTSVDLDIEALVDNFIDIGLYDENGGLIQNLVHYSGSPSSSTFNLPGFTSNTTHVLNQGKYCLRAGLRNDRSTAMGMAIRATISGASLVKPGCCSPFATITGYVYIDKNCNSISDFQQDGDLSGAVISLYDSSGNLIASSTSDVLGYYVFNDLSPGDYTIEQDPISGYSLNQGSAGYSISLASNQVQGNIDFGNCTECCGTSEELTYAVESEITANSIVDTIGHKTTIRLPVLLDCQYISKIIWGDGSSSILNRGDAIPFHDYNAEGAYTISIEVTSESNGVICQVDEVVHTVIVHCISTSVTDINDHPTFILYPVPSSDLLTIELNKNSNGFELQVADFTGKILIKESIDRNTNIKKLDISSLQSGIYILNLLNGAGENLSAKFIKIK